MRPLVAVLLTFALFGCKERPSAPAEPAELRSPQLPATSPAEPALPAQPEAAPEELGDLADFAGFSADESLFAFTVYSEAAGMHLLHVVQGPKGEVKERFQLIDEQASARAREWLMERGFSRKEGSLPGDLRRRLQVDVRSAKARVTLRLPEGYEKLLYEDDPFATFGLAGGVAQASLAKVSPSGDKIAVRVEQVPVTEFGGIVGHIVLDVKGAR